MAILGAMTQRMRTFRRRAKRRTCVSKNTSPVWCVAYAKSPLHAHAPSVSADSGPPPSGTTQEASAASQSASGFLPKGRQRSCTENTCNLLNKVRVHKLQAHFRHFQGALIIMSKFTEFLHTNSKQCTNF